MGLVTEWTLLHKEEPKELWSKAENLEPLGRIEPLS
jgi:hypothetical protein